LSTPDEIEAFRKLELAANGETVKFNKEEGIVIRRMIKGMNAFDVLGKALIWGAGVFGAWKVLGGSVLDIFTKK
jgi:hypothetical protein